MPDAWPATEVRRRSSANGGASTGSGEAPTTISSPRRPRPPSTSLLAAPEEIVVRMTLAPPRACSASPGSPAVLSMYSSAPSSRASCSFSVPRAIATVRKPSLAANWMPRWPSPPTPRIATRSPPRAAELRSALKVVMPAQSSGAASSSARSSGISASALDLTTHVVGVAAVEGDAGDAHVLAADEVAAAAGLAPAAVAAEPADADPLADLPGLRRPRRPRRSHRRPRARGRSGS